MHRDVVAGEERRARAHCLAAYWQERDMVGVLYGGRNDTKCPIDVRCSCPGEQRNIDSIRGAASVLGLAASPLT
jgi:hypothetical protein